MQGRRAGLGPDTRAKSQSLASEWAATGANFRRILPHKTVVPSIVIEIGGPQWEASHVGLAGLLSSVQG